MTKTFSNNGFSISNGRMTKRGLPIDGDEKGFSLSLALDDFTEKICKDNILILSHENNHFPNGFNARGLLSFARAYAKSKGKSLVVSEKLTKKFNIVNHIAGIYDEENENSKIYPMTVDELRECSKLLGNKFVIRPLYMSLKFYDNDYKKFPFLLDNKEIVIPEDVNLVLDLDAMAKYYSNIYLNLRSIPVNGENENNFDNLEIKSTSTADVLLSKISNSPIVALPRIKKDCYSRGSIIFDIKVSEIGLQVVSNKKAFENIEDRVKTTLNVEELMVLPFFLESVNKNKIFSPHLSIKDVKHMPELFDNLEKIKELIKEKPELFINNTKNSKKEDILNCIDRCLESNNPKARKTIQEFYDERMGIHEKLKNMHEAHKSDNGIAIN